MNATEPASESVTISITTADEAATARLAALLAGQCRAGDCIALTGDLGAGKTAFARGFIRALCGESTEVTSPTFTLVQHYPLHGTDGGEAVWHFDLYRMKRREELDEIGLDEALQSGITLIEWPDLARSELPADTLDISIRMESALTHRNFVLNGKASLWENRLSLVKELA
jgi:tRNA threonylcarbamoyl adenosine modification protein YjeE